MSSNFPVGAALSETPSTSEGAIPPRRLSGAHTPLRATTPTGSDPTSTSPRGSSLPLTSTALRGRVHSSNNAISSSAHVGGAQSPGSSPTRRHESEYSIAPGGSYFGATTAGSSAAIERVGLKGGSPTESTTRINRAGPGGSIGNLFRMSKKTSSSASLMSNSGVGGSTNRLYGGFDPQGEDKEDFREWYSELLSDNATIPTPPPSDTITPESVQQWSRTSLFGSSTSTFDALDHAHRVLEHEAALVRAGTLPAVTAAAGRPAITDTPWDAVVPLELHFDGSAPPPPLPPPSAAPANAAGTETPPPSPSRKSAAPAVLISELLTNVGFSSNNSRKNTVRSRPREMDDYQVYQLLVTHRYHTPPAVLLKTLLTTFRDPGTKDRAERTQIQRNIEKILRVWINLFYDDLVLAGAQAPLAKFVADLEQHADTASADGSIFHLVGCALKPLLALKTKSDVMARMARLAAGGGGGGAGTPGGGSSSSDLTGLAAASAGPINLDTAEIPYARDALARADRHYASSLTVPVLDAVARHGVPRTHGFLRPLREYLAYATGLQRWVLHSVEAQPTAKRRAVVVKRMLKLATALGDVGALNAAAVVAGALKHPWIVFQRPVWELLSGKYILMMRALLELVDESDHYAHYISALTSAPAPAGNGIAETPQAKAPFLALHILLAAAYPTDFSSDTTSKWMALYQPLVKILLDIQMQTGSTQPLPPPDAALTAFLAGQPPFDAVAAWQRDIRLADDAAVQAMIKAYRTSSAGGTGRSGPGHAASASLLRSVSGSIAHIFGGGGGGGGGQGRPRIASGNIAAAAAPVPSEGAAAMGMDPGTERDFSTLYGLAEDPARRTSAVQEEE
ncbi:Ras guanine nucleotide exchange factor bud5 [Blastocladiella emersonii ATCC 22665]|nr:Ras guanine nucleotide exchange factor bud5 [Blastocladiella emersonii ATCC 22665]